MELTITTTVDADQRGVVVPVGAIDLATRDELHEAGRAVLADADRTGLVLDLSGVGFMDSTGIGVIVELARDAAELEREFALARPSQRVTRILQVTGLIDVWPVELETSGTV